MFGCKVWVWLWLEPTAAQGHAFSFFFPPLPPPLCPTPPKKHYLFIITAASQQWLSTQKPLSGDCVPDLFWLLCTCAGSALFTGRRLQLQMFTCSFSPRGHGTGEKLVTGLFFCMSKIFRLFIQKDSSDLTENIHYTEIPQYFVSQYPIKPCNNFH